MHPGRCHRHTHRPQPLGGRLAGRPILDYHRPRQAEEENWDLPQIEAAVRAQDAMFPERVERLLPELPEHWLRDAVMRRQRTHQLAPLDPNLHQLCQIYLAATPEQRIFIDPEWTGPTPSS